jgi:CheY-like chemotaxis protein
MIRINEMAIDTDQRQASGLAWLRGKRILLAEDNITNQMVATQMLDALGARVDVANDGAEALEMIESHRYDIYLIDIEMPRVSGLDVIKTIRQGEAPLCDAPVIAVTAYALREHREKISEAGADGLIPKPLISIEQFGRDILSFTERVRRAAATIGAGQQASAPGTVFVSSQPGAAPKPKAAGAARPVEIEVFNGLADAIGEDAMKDLLGKIDSDLDAAVTQVREGVAASDMSLLSNATHVMISVCGAIGAETLKTLSQRLNAVANGKSEENAASIGSDIAMQATVLRAFLKSKAQ